MHSYLISGFAPIAAIPVVVDPFLSSETSVIASGSNLIHSEADLDSIEGKLKTRYGEGAVHRMSRDVVVYNDSRPHIIQRLPGEGDDPVLDFTELVSVTEHAKPIVMFRPGYKDRYSPFCSWMEALRAFGYDMRIVAKHADFRNAIEGIKPDIVCLSALEFQMKHVAQAYRDLVFTRPGAVTLLGGFAATSSTSDFFDIVVPEEGDFVLPLLLRFLQSAIAVGKIDTDDPADGMSLPAHLSNSISDSIRMLTLRRLLPANSEGHHKEVRVDAGSHLLIRNRTDNYRRGIDLNEPRHAWPVPMSSVEMRTLWRIPPGGDITQRNAIIYVQRGCKVNPEKRCTICSITTPAGRRMDVEDVIDIIEQLKERNIRTLFFGDENFLANRAWVETLLDRIKERGLTEGLNLYAQMRTDAWTEPVVRKMWDLGMMMHAGLETMSPVRAERMRKVSQGRGELYVERAKQLMLLAAQYAYENDRSVKDLLQFYMISIGFGDSLDDFIQDILSQLRFIKSLGDRGLGVPSFSFNILERIDSRSPTFEEFGDAKYASRISLEDASDYIDLNLEAEVDMGIFTGSFHMFRVNGDGRLEGVIHPSNFKMDKTMQELSRGIHERLFHGDSPDNYPKPSAELVHDAVTYSLRAMIDRVAEYYGSRKRAEDIVGEIVDLSESIYMDGKKVI